MERSQSILGATVQGASRPNASFHQGMPHSSAESRLIATAFRVKREPTRQARSISEALVDTCRMEVFRGLRIQGRGHSIKLCYV